MIRRLVPFAALLALPILGCDALDFPPLLEPTTPSPAATIQLQYVHGDSLRGDLAVTLRSWLPHGSTAAVTLDGRPIARLQSPEMEARFGESWALGPDRMDGLPQVLGLPGPGDALILLELPALLRTGSAVVCVTDADPLLSTSAVALSGGSVTGWTLQLTSRDATLVIQGNGSPPEPLRVPRELLGSMAESWSALLVTFLHVEPDFADSPDTRGLVYGRLIVEWTLVGRGLGARCPSPP